MFVTRFCRRVGKNGQFQAALDLVVKDLLNKTTMQYSSPSGSKAKFFGVLVPTLIHNFRNIF